MRYFTSLIALLFIGGCASRQGDLYTRSAPETQIFLSKINLSDSTSLSGKIALYWSGESKNGFIKGYEIANDTFGCSANPTLNWTFTQKTDSLFLFSLPSGKKYSKVSFRARAIDDLDVVDNTPACLEIPIQNAVPSIAFQKLFNSKVTTDTVHLVFTVSWEAEDPDGIENLDSVFLKLNDNDWVSFPKTIKSVTILPIDPTSSTTSDCKLLLNESGTSSNIILKGLKMNNQNFVCIKTKDISSAESKIDTSNVFYLKRQRSNFLVLDGYKDESAFYKPDRDFYRALLPKLFGFDYDFYDFNRSNNAYIPVNWNLTFLEYLKYYKKIYWFSDASNYVSDNSNPLLLIELGAVAIQKYLDQGGKMMISQANLSNDTQSPIFDFSTADSVYLKTNARLASNTKFILSKEMFPDIDTLYKAPSSSVLNGRVSPFYKKASSIGILKATSLTQANNADAWPGPLDFGAYSKGSNGKANLIFFSLPLHELNGNQSNIERVFEKIIKEEFE